MTLHDAMVMFTGLCFLGTGMALGVTGRLLGPDYRGKITVGPRWRLFFWAISLVTVLRGLTILFPGDLVAVDRMSVVMPLEAAAFLALALVVLNFVMADRAPPPLIERVLRSVGVRLTDRELIDITMHLPLVEHAASSKAEAAQDRRFRLRVMAAGAILIFAALATMLWNSPIGG